MSLIFTPLSNIPFSDLFFLSGFLWLPSFPGKHFLRLGCQLAELHSNLQLIPKMASQSTGIQQLLVAEKKAAEKVSDARKRKAKRLKQAKEEAQAEIEKYR